MHRGHLERFQMSHLSHLNAALANSSHPAVQVAPPFMGASVPTAKQRFINMDSLSHFDKLPDSAHVRLGVVMALFACSAPTVWRRVKAGHLPAPVRKLPGTRIAAWRVADLRAILESV